MVKTANDIYAQADETCRVQLLIGKTYDVMSTQPLSVVGRSDEAIEVFDVGPCSFSVVWPVTFTVGEGRYATRPLLGATWNDGGRSFYVLRDPPFLRGNYFWAGGCWARRVRTRWSTRDRTRATGTRRTARAT